MTVAAIDSKRCERCGARFVPYRQHQKYCSRGRCRQLAWDARHPRLSQPGQGRRRCARFECGSELARLADELVELGHGETRQEVVELALRALLSTEADR